MAQTPKPQNPRINRAHPLSRGLTAAWAFTEGGGDTLRDIAGAGDGTLTNGPTWTSSPYGHALDFDGVDDHVLTTLTEHHSAYTISAWVNVDDWTRPNMYEPFVSKGHIFDATDFEFAMGIRTHDSLPQYRGFVLYSRSGGVQDGIEVSQVLGYLSSPASTLYPSGTWIHVAAIWAPGRQEFYINGELKASRTIAAGPGTSALAVKIGGPHTDYTAPGGGGEEHFDGQIADVRIWSRRLPETSIRSLYRFPWQQYTRPLFGMPNALYTIGGGSSATVGADATAGFPDLLALTSGLLSVPPLVATAGYKSVMSMCGVYIDSAGLPLPSGGGGGKGVRRRRIPMVLFDDAEDGIVINAALDSFGAI